MSQCTINDSTSFSYNRSPFDVSNRDHITDNRSQVLAWLSHLEPSLRHWEIQERRVKNVGEWLLQTEQFKRWCGLDGEGESDNAVLFCYGNLGVGKTFISSLVVDRLRHWARGQNTAVACFYLDFTARKEQSATSILGSLLKQIVSGMEGIPEGISRAFQEQKKTIGGCRAQLADIVMMLQAVTSSQPTYICIDALDECAGVERVRLLDSLKEILEESPGTRIFMTGRSYIRAEIERRLAGQVAYVSISPNRGDIITYLRVRLSQDQTPEAMDESLEAEILEKIPEKMSEMFLLVSLNIEAILQESTTYRRRERLRKMASRLGPRDAYGPTIQRIKAQNGDKSRLGMEALMWMSHAERPLRVNELFHALAIEPGSTDFNASNIPSVSTLLACCQGLVTVDKEESTVLPIHSLRRKVSAVLPIHFTLREYLSASPNIFSGPHSTMAEICLTYLGSQQAGDTSDDPFDIPFLEYCSLYWGVHAKRELSDSARSLALSFCQGADNHISTLFLLLEDENQDPAGFASRLGSDAAADSCWGLNPSFRFGGLHCASFFGIVEVVTALVEMGGYDINQGDGRRYTPLAWAARKGHEGVVKVLLGRKEVEPDRPNNCGRTPLSYAAEHGHEGVVKMLLGHEEVNPDKPDNRGRTPLSYAAQSGGPDVVRILLSREEVNPNNLDNEGNTPLFIADSPENWFGNWRVVALLEAHLRVNDSTV